MIKIKRYDEESDSSDGEKKPIMHQFGIEPLPNILHRTKNGVMLAEKKSQQHSNQSVGWRSPNNLPY